MTQPGQTMVREYKGKHRQDAYRKDAQHLAGEGWQVVSVQELSQRIGCLRWLFIGLLALIFRPHSILVVTYSRVVPAPIPPPAPPIIVVESLSVAPPPPPPPMPSPPSAAYLNPPPPPPPPPA